MPNAPKPAGGHGPFRRLSDSETLLFLARSLQPSSADADPPDVFANLQSLKDALAKIESALLDCPDTPVKVRMWNELAKARGLVRQIADDCAGAANGDAARRNAKTA